MKEKRFNGVSTLIFLDIKIRVCQAEDLIIQRVVSTREKDWMDNRLRTLLPRKTAIYAKGGLRTDDYIKDSVSNFIF